MPRTVERLRIDAIRLAEELRADAARLRALRRDSPDAALHVRLQTEYSGTTLERLQALERRIPANSSLLLRLNQAKRSVKTKNYPLPIEPHQFNRVWPGNNAELALDLQTAQTNLAEVWALATWLTAKEEPARWVGCTVGDLDDHRRQIAALEQSCRAKQTELEAIEQEVETLFNTVRSALEEIRKVVP